VHHAFQLAEYLSIRESKDRIALRLEPGVTFSIDSLPRLEIVTPSVKLYDDARRVADEISDVIPHRDLPAKAEPFDSMRLDVAPQERLGASHPLPELLRSGPMLFAHCRVRHVSPPYPPP